MFRAAARKELRKGSAALRGDARHAGNADILRRQKNRKVSMEPCARKLLKHGAARRRHGIRMAQGRVRNRNQPALRPMVYLGVNTFFPAEPQNTCYPRFIAPPCKEEESACWERQRATDMEMQEIGRASCRER